MYKNFISNLEKSLLEKFNINNVFSKCVTKNGNTQKAEATYMPYIKEVLNDKSLKFDQASSQSSKDIRLVNPEINFEVKKTDSTTIILNDTLPSKDIYYIYILTGTTKYKPQLKIINGYEFIKGNEWYQEYIDKVNKLRDTYCRGLNKKCRYTPLKCYLRPTWSVDLKHFDLLTY